MLSWASRIFHKMDCRDPVWKLPEGLPKNTVGLVCLQLSGNA